MKQEIISQIIQLMDKNGITAKDIIVAVSNKRKAEMDLLCLVNGKKVRLPFEKGKKETVLGIFPFKSNVYLYAEETGEVIRTGAIEERIPTYDFFRELYVIKKELNEVLEELGLAPIEGAYFVEPIACLQRPSWIVAIDEKGFSSDYYDNDVKAKIRYCGTFE